MNVEQAVKRIRVCQNHVAVYDELLSYLQSALDDGLEIPTSTQDENVPVDVVVAVMERLVDERAVHELEITHLGERKVDASPGILRRKR